MFYLHRVLETLKKCTWEKPVTTVKHSVYFLAVTVLGVAAYWAIDALVNLIIDKL